MRLFLGKKVVDQETQTVYCKYVLSSKVETMILKNEMSTSQDCKPKIVSSLAIKNIRCIVDYTEFRVECSRNFARQGNTFSAYKHTNTLNCLIPVTPNGGASFVSYLYEGDIDDTATFKGSGILKHLEPGDLVMADRGFTVRELLNPRQVQIMISTFLKGRKSLTAAEDLETRRIAKARIHVERFNKWLKVAEHSFQVPMPNSPLLLNYLRFGSRFLQE